MKSKVFKYWAFNFVMSLVFFLVYRIVISQTKTEDSHWLDLILEILKIFLDFGYSLIYLAAMLVCSTFIFLNLNKTVRTNFYYSLLSFIGPATLFTLYCLLVILINGFTIQGNPLYLFVWFCFISICFSCIQFLLFRKHMVGIQ